MVIIPVDEFDVCGDFFGKIFGNAKVFDVILAAVLYTDKHIAPHMQRKAVFICYFGDLFNMT